MEKVNADGEWRLGKGGKQREWLGSLTARNLSRREIVRNSVSGCRSNFLWTSTSQLTRTLRITLVMCFIPAM